MKTQDSALKKTQYLVYIFFASVCVPWKQTANWGQEAQETDWGRTPMGVGATRAGVCRVTQVGGRGKGGRKGGVWYRQPQTASLRTTSTKFPGKVCAIRGTQGMRGHVPVPPGRGCASRPHRPAEVTSSPHTVAPAPQINADTLFTPFLQTMQVGNDSSPEKISPEQWRETCQVLPWRQPGRCAAPGAGPAQARARPPCSPCTRQQPPLAVLYPFPAPELEFHGK